MLGARDRTWFVLRVASSAVRHVFANAVAEGFRKGPHAIRFQGAQWMMAVEEYLHTGYPETDSTEVWVGAVEVFPYVRWAPGITVHYLWRVFAICGSRLLACLGDRVVEWGRLRSSARGFHSHVLYAVIGWLRDTGIQRVADGWCSFEAADAYILSGVRAFPFEEREDAEDDPTIDERPVRGLAWRPNPVLRLAPVADALLGASSSSSGSLEGDESSTADPSVGSVDALGSSEDGREAQLESVSSRLGLASGQAGPTYAADEGFLLVAYVDDVLRVPLPGWTLEEVDTIVHGLQTGDWGLFQQMMARAQEGSSGLSSEGVVPGLRGFRMLTRFQGFGLRGVFLIFWIIFSLLKVAVAQESGFSEAVDLWSGPKDSCELTATPAFPDIGDPDGEQGYGCDGSVLWEIARFVSIGLIWEASRLLWNKWFRSRKLSRDVGSQTEGDGVLCLPLGAEVRCRSRILFCLWRAGFKFEVDTYPERIQSEFYHSVGTYLSRLEDGVVSESESD